MTPAKQTHSGLRPASFPGQVRNCRRRGLWITLSAGATVMVLVGVAAVVVTLMKRSGPPGASTNASATTSALSSADYQQLLTSIDDELKNDLQDLSAAPNPPALGHAATAAEQASGRAANRLISVSPAE